MTFAKIWIQIKKGWEEIHQEAEELHKKSSLPGKYAPGS